MFDLEQLKEFQYIDPWSQSYNQRLSNLGRRKVKVAYFYERPDNSTFRYRVYNMIQVLDSFTDDFSAAYFCLADKPNVAEIARIADILIVCRSRYTTTVGTLIQAFKSRGKKVFYDIDDHVFDTSLAHLIADTLDEDISEDSVMDHWFAYIGRLGETLKHCDAGITTNAYLADRMQRFAQIPVSIIPNFMNREQIEFSAKVVEAKRNQVLGHNGNIHVGYFSGSPSHNRDFQLITPAIEQLLETSENVELVVVGYLEYGKELDRFKSRIKRFPFHDYVNLQRLIGSVEYNLMPLQNNVFTNCKSELKYFEAAAVGSLCIASPSFTYAKAISNGETGFISSSFDWFGTFDKVVGDNEIFKRVTAAAMLDALKEFSWETQVNAIRGALGYS